MLLNIILGNIVVNLIAHIYIYFKFDKNFLICRQQIVGLINANQVVVVSGETGCGKTTQVICSTAHICFISTCCVKFYKNSHSHKV